MNSELLSKKVQNVYLDPFNQIYTIWYNFHLYLGQETGHFFAFFYISPWPETERKKQKQNKIRLRKSFRHGCVTGTFHFDTSNGINSIKSTECRNPNSSQFIVKLKPQRRLIKYIYHSIKLFYMFPFYCHYCSSFICSQTSFWSHSVRTRCVCVSNELRKSHRNRNKQTATHKWTLAYSSKNEK